MFTIQSEKLGLMALSYKQLMLLAEDRSKLEVSLGLAVSQFELNAPPSFMEEFNWVIPNYMMPQVKANPQRWEWFTHWLMIDKSANLTVGGIGSRGFPDAHGETMIGYFTDGKFEGQGIATEAVKLFSAWLFKEPATKAILAETLVTGIGSQKVLQKASFVYDGECEDGLRWRLSR